MRLWKKKKQPLNLDPAYHVIITTMDQTIAQIINDDIDLYAVLGVSSDSTPQDIRRAYRQKALLFHPDKYDGDETKFNLILKSYEILSDTSLKSKYDELCQIKLTKLENRAKLDDLTRRFQDELIASELKRQKHRHPDIESMKQEGLKKRRIQEQKLFDEKKTCTTIYDIPLNNNVSVSLTYANTTVSLKYKFKKELETLIDENVLSKIMLIFGEVTKVTMNGHDNRYAYAYIDFATIDGCNQALRHNYSESARKWDGTEVRKLASLLRECKKADTGNSDFTNNDKVNQILRDYLKSVNSRI